jgi:hypothetical protein
MLRSCPIVHQIPCRATTFHDSRPFSTASRLPLVRASSITPRRVTTRRAHHEPQSRPDRASRRSHPHRASDARIRAGPRAPRAAARTRGPLTARARRGLPPRAQGPRRPHPHRASDARIRAGPRAPRAAARTRRHLTARARRGLPPRAQGPLAARTQPCLSGHRREAPPQRPPHFADAGAANSPTCSFWRQLLSRLDGARFAPRRSAHSCCMLPTRAPATPAFSTPAKSTF